MFASLHTSTLAVNHVQTRGSLADIANRLRAGLSARAQRKALLSLDDHLLADIGLSYAQALTEASRSVWDMAPLVRR
jgi:uncharacterized protein YjiS (DUF1127 family)